MPAALVMQAAVEGDVDEAVVRRLLAHVGVSPGQVYGKNGKPDLRRKMPGYHNAACYAPWIIVVDLDHDADCAPPFRLAWLPQPTQYLCFRVAVRAVEAWLLGDREGIASFLSVGLSRVPTDPEALDNPKETIVNLARRSRRRAIREDMVPRPGSGRSEGPAYASRLIEFASGTWRPAEGATRSDSLSRAMNGMRDLAATWSARVSL